MKYRIGLYEKAMPAGVSWEEKLSAAKKAGFDYLEMSIDETGPKLERLNWSREERWDLCRAAYKASLPIRSICLSGHRKYPLGSEDEAIQARSLEIGEKAICLAADLGIPIIQIAGYDVYYEPSTHATRVNFLKNLEKLVEFASGHQVTLAFETMETPFLDTVEKAMHYVKLIRSPYLQIYPDIGNITNAAKLYGGSAEEDLQKGTGHIAAVHLKESLPGKYREIAFGAGHVDFANIIQTCLNIGVRCFVTEFWHLGEDDWRASLRDANTFIRGQFRQFDAAKTISADTNIRLKGR